MATTVNTTVERIVLETLDRGSEASVRKVGAAIGELRSGLDTVSNALAAVGVVIGTGAMIELHRQVLEADAGLADLAKSGGASVEMLSAIRRSAQVGGHDFQGFHGQLAKTIRGLQDTTEEGGKSERALGFLGIKARDGSGRLRDLGEVALELGKKLRQYQDTGEKVALVQDALGKGAERYIALLEDMGEGTDFHVTVTAKQAEELERVEKEMRRFNAAIEDGRRLIVNEYAPAFRELLEQGTQGIRIFGGFWSAVWNVGIGINPFKTTAENIRELNRLIEQAETETPFQRARRESILGGRADLETLRKRREFLILQQQQQVAQFSGDEYLDARDIMLQRGTAPRARLTYRTQSEGDRAKLLREAEINARAIVELEEMAAADSREAWEAYTKHRIAQQDRVLEIRHLNERAIIESIDREQEQAIEQGEIILNSREAMFERHYRDQREVLIRNRELGIITQREFNEYEAELTAEHQRRLTGMHNFGWTERQRFAQLSQAKQTATLIGMMEGMTASAAVHSKKMFAVHKTLATANALIKGYEAVQSAYAFGSAWGGPFAGAAMAALAAAATAIQVKAIQATEFGGGGAVGTFQASPATGLPAQPAAQAAPRRSVIVQFMGSQRDEDTIRRFVDTLNENTDDGGQIIVARRR